MFDDRRLIEDFLPIQAISAEASREKSVRKGHISTLHLRFLSRNLPDKERGRKYATPSSIFRTQKKDEPNDSICQIPSGILQAIVAAMFYEISAEAISQANE